MRKYFEHPGIIEKNGTVVLKVLESRRTIKISEPVFSELLRRKVFKAHTVLVRRGGERFLQDQIMEIVQEQEEQQKQEMRRDEE